MGSSRVQARIAVVGTGYWAQVIIGILHRLQIPDLTIFSHDPDSSTFKSLPVHNWSTVDIHRYTHFFLCCGPSYHFDYLSDIVEFARKDSFVWCEKPFFLNGQQLFSSHVQELQDSNRLFINYPYITQNLTSHPFVSNSLSLFSASSIIDIHLHIRSRNAYTRPHHQLFDFTPHHLCLIALILRTHDERSSAHSEDLLSIINDSIVATSPYGPSMLGPNDFTISIGSRRFFCSFGCETCLPSTLNFEFQCSGHSSSEAFTLPSIFINPVNQNVSRFLHMSLESPAPSDLCLNIVFHRLIYNLSSRLLNLL